MMNWQQSDASSGPKCKRELCDRKDPLVVLLFPFFLAQIAKETKVVLINRQLPTSLLELTLTAMAIQNQRRRCARILVLSDS
jgi:hypothetical protein